MPADLGLVGSGASEVGVITEAEGKRRRPKILNSRLDAQTVEEGLKIARSLRPDLVITDIHLPDGKGFDVLRGLRKQERTAHIPVVALTADAMPSNLHNMELAGFDYILTKPLKIPDLMEILRATLKAA